MNEVQWKNNLYKNGWYAPSNSKAMILEKARNKTPSHKQIEYRDALYKFCCEKGLIRDGFRIYRTNRGISSNIQAFLTILRKNGFTDEFFSKRQEEGDDHG